MQTLSKEEKNGASDAFMRLLVRGWKTRLLKGLKGDRMRRSDGMERKRFSSDEIADIVMKLTGEVCPVGSSEVDRNRFDNILLLMNVVDILIDEIQLQVPCQNNYAASVKKIGLEAARWVMEKKEYFDNYFDD